MKKYAVSWDIMGFKLNFGNSITRIPISKHIRIIKIPENLRGNPSRSHQDPSDPSDVTLAAVEGHGSLEPQSIHRHRPREVEAFEGGVAVVLQLPWL